MDLDLFLVGLFVLFSAAVLVGELMTRIGQAALVGQLAVGVVLGPTLLGPYLGLNGSSDAISGIQFLATFFILVMAGLDISPEALWATGRSGLLLGLAVFLVPFGAGAILVPLVYPGLPYLTSLFVALTLSITALPVMGVMLSEFRIGKTPMGALLLNAAVINELAAVTVFAILLRLHSSVTGGADLLGVAIAVVSVLLFLSAVLTVHMALRALRESRVWFGLRDGFRRTWRSKEAGFAVLMMMALGAALFSQYLGLTFLVGAFYAGLLVTPQSAGRQEHRSISQVFDAMTWGFFIPLFFAFVGLQMDLGSLVVSVPALASFAVLVAFAILSKFLAGERVARAIGWSAGEARSIGFLVSSRGAVELAMALLLLQAGVFTLGLYTVVAGVGLVTTVLAPIGAAHLGHLPRPSSEDRRLERSGAGTSLPPLTPALSVTEVGDP